MNTATEQNDAAERVRRYERNMQRAVDLHLPERFVSRWAEMTNMASAALRDEGTTTTSKNTD